MRARREGWLGCGVIGDLCSMIEVSSVACTVDRTNVACTTGCCFRAHATNEGRKRRTSLLGVRDSLVRTSNLRGLGRGRLRLGLGPRTSAAWTLSDSWGSTNSIDFWWQYGRACE